jgi:HTH-type transcriptional regulator / antitoxin HigA
MNEATQNQYTPDSVSAPGETLEEVLQSRAMSQAEFAERTGRPKKTINEIVRGKAAITAETALQFERVLGIPAAFWMSREQNYQEAVARERELGGLSRHTDWLKNVPYSAMVKLGWIPGHRDKTRQLDEVLRYFGVASTASWEDVWTRLGAAFRKSATLRAEPGSVAAWLRRGEIQASGRACADFSPGAFRDVLHRIRALTRDLPQDFAFVVERECASAGVYVVFVPELPGTRVWGATRWLTPTRALIQLSLRYETDDHLWFTFFHEAGHILLHGRREVFLEGDVSQAAVQESEADAFAREWLIPEKRYRVFRRLGTRSCAAVSRFAYELGIAPGIVVGCMQHDGLLPRTACNDLKKRVGFDQE